MALEKNVAALERGVAGYAFASGMAATTALTHLLLKQGDHAICSDNVYGGTFRLFDKIVRHYGVEFTYVNTSNLSDLENAIRRNTRMVFIETPTNPIMSITDIRRVSDIAHQADCRVVVDNTFMTPYFQLPLELGADIVVHSTTKYLNGHSDVVGGAVVVKDSALLEELDWWGNCLGVTGSPFDSYLTLRGLRSLHVRMRQHAENAATIVAALFAHPAIGRLYYPGLPGHPGHALAVRQQRSFGAMIGIELAGGKPAVRRFLDGLRFFSLAESLGGVESLVAHPDTMTHAGMDPAARLAAGITPGLLRVSVGIEAAADLVADLTAALDRAQGRLSAVG
jgi:cystathionine gamma-synthase